MKKILLIPLLGMLLVIQSANSEPDAHEDLLQTSTSLSMRETLDRTVQKQPQQASLRARQIMVDAKRTQVENLLPEAPLLNMSHQTDTIGSSRNEREWQIGMELPIWLPNQRGARHAVAELAAQNLHSDQASLVLMTASQLRDAVWDVQMNLNEAALYEKKLEAAKRLELDIEKRVQAGESARTDLMLVQQETLQVQKALIRVQAELMHARYRYILLTGDNEFPGVIEEPLSSLQDYSQSPLWLAAESKIQLSEGERDLSRIEKKTNPQLVLSTRSIRGGFDQQFNQSVGIGIRIPLGGEQYTAPVQAASEQALGNAINERESLRRALDAALHEAEHNLEVSKQELALAEKQMQIATESARLAEKAHKLGELDLTSLIRIQAQTFEAERSFSSRQIQVKWNIARFNQAVGVLP